MGLALIVAAAGAAGIRTQCQVMVTRCTHSVSLATSPGDIGVIALCMPTCVLTGTGMAAVPIGVPAARAGTALVIGFGCRITVPVVSVRAAGGSVFGTRTHHNAVVDTSPRTDVVIGTLNRGGTPNVVAITCAITVVATPGTTTCTPTVVATPGATTSAEAPQMPTGTRRRARTLKTTTPTVIAEIKGTEGAARQRARAATRTTARTTTPTVREVVVFMLAEIEAFRLTRDRLTVLCDAHRTTRLQRMFGRFILFVFMTT